MYLPSEDLSPEKAILPMGSSVNRGPVLGPKHTTAPVLKKNNDPKRDPNFQNYPYGA